MTVSPEEMHEWTGRVGDDGLVAAAAELLRSNSLEVALRHVVVLAQESKIVPQDFMRSAAQELLRSDDSDAWDRALDYFAWAAEQFPSLDEADNFTYDAKYSADVDESRYVVQRCFEIGLIHLRSLVKTEGYTPERAFAFCFDLIAMRIDEEGLPDLYLSAAREFAPTLVTIAEQYSPTRAIRDRDGAKAEIDSALCTVAIALQFDPGNEELARQARELITDSYIKADVDQQWLDKAFMSALASENLSGVAEVLADKRYMYVSRPWRMLAERLESAHNLEEVYAWADNTVDMVVASRPEFLEKPASKNDDSVDIFIGPDAGYVLGVLGRMDIVDRIVTPDRPKNTALHFIGAVARGLGRCGDAKGLEHLLEVTSHYDEVYRGAVHSGFTEATRST